MADKSYTTTQGDTWDAIAYKLWGVETLLHHLARANPDHLDTLIFPAGIVLAVPQVTIPTKTLELPPWMQP